jgi:uncharacterized membrane protein YkvA (DUF1232 family)
VKFTEKVLHFGGPQGKLRLLLHGPNLIKLYWRLFTDRRVSVIPKAVLVAGIVYFVVPMDFIPDFPMVGLGQLDDVAVLALALKGFISMAPRTVVEEHVRLIDEGV